jgi:D-alanyl-lipoteichoic acid acyltransferase DltB (MBOAT superfamily)
MPAFDALPARRELASDLAVGLSIFAIGLAKKVLIADPLGAHVGPVFDAPAGAAPPDMLAAWTALMAYTFQLYFDFSGYSDMALGLGRMFGIPLPVNFFSPYKAQSIAQFWRRWHMTLSAFLRDYLYFPLGGNRHGRWRTARNLFLTMAIGGLWHGANWTFVAWGCWHGGWLVLQRLLADAMPRARPPRMLATAITFLLVSLGWVWFRAPTMHAAATIHEALFTAAGTTWPAAWQPAWSMIGVAAALAFAAPNTCQLFARFQPGLLPAGFAMPASRLQWSLRPASGLAVGVLLLVAALSLSRETVFLYFQF